jgi:hypothetical protein
LCGIMGWEVTLALGIIRCVEVQNDNGVPPSGAAISADGYVMLDDLAAIQEAIICNENTYRPGTWFPLGPQGGCAGGEWHFTVRIQPCGCPPEDHDG